MKIGIWGDSIVYGANDIEGGGWASRLRRFLIEKAEKENKSWPKVYVRGVCGDTTKELSVRFKVEADSIEPEIIIFGIGINDAAYTKNENETLVPYEEFVNNLEFLIRQAKKFSKKVIFIGLTTVDEKIVQPYPYSSTGKSYSNALINKYDKTIQEVAYKNQCGYIPLMPVVSI